jgi:hypothetical protein
MYPKMPIATFDVHAWFEIAFPKPQFNWYQFNEDYHNNLNIWKSNEEKYLKTKYQNNFEIIDIGNGKRTLKFRPVTENGRWSYEDYISRGEWDNPNFSENERILAWRIECNRLNK